LGQVFDGKKIEYMECNFSETTGKLGPRVHIDSQRMY